MEENGNNEIILSPEKKEKVFEEKSITIDINSKEGGEIEREITAAYINNYKTIKLVGKDIEKKSYYIRTALKDLSGLEVLEQTKDYIIAKDFINIGDLSLLHLIRRVDIIARNMLLDVKDSLHISHYQSLMQRDKDVNRLVFLIYRTCKFFIANSDYLAKNHQTLSEIIVFWKLSDYLEQFADETKRISRSLETLTLRKDEKNELGILFNSVEQCYLNSMKSFYASDRSLAFTVAKDTKKMIDKCRKLGMNMKEKEGIILIERFKTMLDKIRAIAQLTYN